MKRAGIYLYWTLVAVLVVAFGFVGANFQSLITLLR